VDIQAEASIPGVKRIRFGVIGSGYMGRTNAEAIRRLDQTAALVAVCGGAEAPELARLYGCALEPSAEALLARPDVDAVAITTSPHLAATEGIWAIEAGKHALVEKPVTTSLDEYDRVMAMATGRGLILAMSHFQRFRLNNRRALELIRQGAIGSVATVQVSMPYERVLKPFFYEGGVKAKPSETGALGPTLNGAPHAIDLVRLFTGAEIRQLTAFSRSFIPGQKVEDTTAALVEFSSGAFLSIFVSNALPAPIFPDDHFRFRIMGSEGLILLDPYDELRIADKNGWRLASKQEPIDYQSAATAFGDVRMQTYCDQMQSFIDTINGRPARAGQVTVATAADGRAGLKACLAMFQASREQRWVRLDS